jgi:hypothetical protein
LSSVSVSSACGVTWPTWLGVGAPTGAYRPKATRGSRD